jgi:hypothetical protein
MRPTSRMLAVVVALAALAGLPRVADAGIIITQVQVRPVGDPVFRYTMDVFLEAGTVIVATDFFTVYDIPFMQAGSNIQPTQWAASFNLLGVTPGGVSVTDDPTLLNVTWTRFGGGTISVPPNQSRRFLGQFSIETTDDATFKSIPKFLEFASQTTDPNTGAKVGSSGRVRVDVVPEPASLALVGSGSLLAAMVWRRRRR